MGRLKKIVRNGIKKLMSGAAGIQRPRTAMFVQNRLSIADAKALLIELYRVKIAFHEQKLALGADTPAELRYSRQRIAELQASLRNALDEVNLSDQWVDISASIQVTAVKEPLR